MASVTMDTFGEELEDTAVEFALQNWCNFWHKTESGLFQKSHTTHLNLIKKILDLDLMACILHTYFNPGRTWRPWDQSPMAHFFEGSKPSNFFVGSGVELRRHTGISSTIRKLRSHVQSSLDAAYIHLVQTTNFTPPQPSAGAKFRIACHCATHLQEVTSQPNWEANKLVRALRNPGKAGTIFFEEVVKCLYDQKLPRRDEAARRELLLNIDEAIVKVGSKALLYCRDEFWFDSDDE
jgi:hypothetical protein